MSFVIYKHTNKINNKSYIGQTCQDPERRWRADGSGYKDSPLFWAAIEKYGWENFSHEILEENLTQDEANIKEQYWIKYYNTYGENSQGYNLTPGGKNYMHEYWENPSFKEKMKQSFSKSKKAMPQEHKENIQKRLQEGLQKAWSDEQWKKERINNLKGKNNPNSKKVYNFESNITFETINDAAQWAGLKAVSGIGQCCAGKQKTSGKHPVTGVALHWCYESDKENYQIPKNNCKKTVICLNNNQTFESYSAAARWCNLKDSGKSIKACCDKKQQTAGTHPQTGERLRWKEGGG